MEQGFVDLSKSGGIARITFFHPQSNSMPGKLLNDLAQVITNAGNDASVKVILLQSKGDKAFCAGASFDELIAIKNIETGTVFFSGFAKVINAIRKAPKFVVARVQGKAVGGGVGIASAADFCFGVKAASVKLSELAVGIGPFVVGPAVERKIGKAAFSALSINATEWHGADWAFRCGLFSELHETVENMDHAIEALLSKLENSSPDAMKELKSVFWEGCENWDELLAARAAISGRLVLSDFTVNAISAFKAK
jgi:methylglutaconyl-CoA hydratase